METCGLCVWLSVITIVFSGVAIVFSVATLVSFRRAAIKLAGAQQ